MSEKPHGALKAQPATKSGSLTKSVKGNGGVSKAQTSDSKGSGNVAEKSGSRQSGSFRHPAQPVPFAAAAVKNAITFQAGAIPIVGHNKPGDPGTALYRARANAAAALQKLPDLSQPWAKQQLPKQQPQKQAKQSHIQQPSRQMHSQRQGQKQQGQQQSKELQPELAQRQTRQQVAQQRSAK